MSVVKCKFLYTAWPQHELSPDVFKARIYWFQYIGTQLQDQGPQHASKFNSKPPKMLPRPSNISSKATKQPHNRFKISPRPLPDASIHQTRAHVFIWHQTITKQQNSKFDISKFRTHFRFYISHVTSLPETGVFNERQMHLYVLPKAATVWFRSTTTNIQRLITLQHMTACNQLNNLQTKTTRRACRPGQLNQPLGCNNRCRKTVLSKSFLDLGTQLQDQGPQHASKINFRPPKMLPINSNRSS